MTTIASILPNTPVITESGSVTFSITLTPANTGTYYWAVSNASPGLTSDDFSDNLTSGNVVISGGVGSLVRGLKEDFVFENSESFNITLYDGIGGNIIGVSPTVTVLGSIVPVDVGSAPNDGTGDPIRNAFIKVNSNDTNISTRLGVIETKFITGNILLGIETTGNYVANVLGGNSIIIANSGGESSNPIISVSTTAPHFILGAQDAVGLAINAGSQSGITVSYSSGRIDYDVNDFNIELTGPITGNVTVVDLADVSIETTITNNSVILGQHTVGEFLAQVAVSGNGLSLTGLPGEGVTQTVVSNATAANVANTIVYRDSVGNFEAGTITATKVIAEFEGNILGTSSNNVLKSGDTMTGPLFLPSATPIFSTQAVTKGYVDNELDTNVAITLNGEVLGNGFARSTITTALSTTGVSAGTYTQVTVDTKGRVTSATNPITLAGYGITDAVNNFGSQVIGGDKTFNDNVVILGNLTVLGNTVNFEANTLIVNDPIMYVGANNPADSIDLGFVAHYNDGTEKHTGIVRLNETKVWTFFSNIAHSTMNDIDPSDPDFRYADVRANVFIGNLVGNADTVTALQTTRTIGLSGDATGNVSFNGTSNAIITTTLSNSGVIAGVYGSGTQFTQLTLDSKGRVTSAANIAATTTNITEGTNLYFTAARVRANISAGTGINYNSGTGVITNAGVTSFNGNTGDITFDPGDINTVLGYTPSRAGATNTYSLASNDTRTVDDTPNALGVGFYPQIKNNSVDGLNDGGTAHGVLTFRSSATFADNRVFQYAQTDSGNIHVRSSTSATTWTLWGKIWTSENDGVGSELDADLVQGRNSSSASAADTVVVRDASQNFSANTVTASLNGTALRATNLAGGVAGAIPYQTAANTTGFSAAGLSSQVLISNGTSAPSWVNQSSLSVGTAINATNSTLSAINTDNSSTSPQFVVFSPSATGNQGLKASTTNLTFIPSSGTLATNIFSGTATSARYADLAEIYASDEDYPPGTVVIFGGQKEITVSFVEEDSSVAGVISSNPAYLMNSAAQGLPVALRGRVPCKVIGPVYKGDCLVTSNVPGYARRAGANPAPGSIFAKSLESVDFGEHIIEVVVV